MSMLLVRLELWTKAVALPDMAALYSDAKSAVYQIASRIPLMISALCFSLAAIITAMKYRAKG